MANAHEVALVLERLRNEADHVKAVVAELKSGNKGLRGRIQALKDSSQPSKLHELQARQNRLSAEAARVEERCASAAIKHEGCSTKMQTSRGASEEGLRRLERQLEDFFQGGGLFRQRVQNSADQTRQLHARLSLKRSDMETERAAAEKVAEDVRNLQRQKDALAEELEKSKDELNARSRAAKDEERMNLSRRNELARLNQELDKGSESLDEILAIASGLKATNHSMQVELRALERGAAAQALKVETEEDSQQGGFQYDEPPSPAPQEKKRNDSSDYPPKKKFKTPTAASASTGSSHAYTTPRDSRSSAQPLPIAKGRATNNLGGGHSGPSISSARYAEVDFTPRPPPQKQKQKEPERTDKRRQPSNSFYGGEL